MSAYLSNDSVELSSWDAAQYNWDVPAEDDFSESVNFRTDAMFQPFQTQDPTTSFEAIFLPSNQENTLAPDSSRFEVLDEGNNALNDPVVNAPTNATRRPPRNIVPSSNLPNPPTILTPRKPRWKRHNPEGTIFGHNKYGRKGRLSCVHCRKRKIKYASEGERCDYCVSRDLECKKVWGPGRATPQSVSGSPLSAPLFVLRTSDLSAQEICYLAVATDQDLLLLQDIKHHYGPLFGNSGTLLSAVLALSAAESASMSSPELRQSHCISAYEFISCFHRRMREDIKRAEKGNINESHILAFCIALLHCSYNLDGSRTWRKTYRCYLRGLVEITREVLRKNNVNGPLHRLLRDVFDYVRWMSVNIQFPHFGGFICNYEDTLASDTLPTFRLFDDHVSPLLPQMPPAFDIHGLTAHLVYGIMACFQKYYSDYWKMGQSGDAILDEIGIMLLDLQKMLDGLLQHVSVIDYFNLNYSGPANRTQWDGMSWGLANFLQPALLLPVLRHLIFGEPLPLYNNTFRFMRAVETHLHLWDHVGWRQSRPFLIAAMAFVMSFDSMNHEVEIAWLRNETFKTHNPISMWEPSDL